MRPFAATIAALLLAAAVPPTVQAETTATATPVCHCPRPHAVHARRPLRHVRHYVRHVRRRAPAAGPPPFVAVAYNTMIPSPADTAYDRAMVLHLRSMPVSGLYFPDLGYPSTPPVQGAGPYRKLADGTVLEYDGITGQYIPLSQVDASAVMPPPPPPPLAPPPAKP